MPELQTPAGRGSAIACATCSTRADVRSEPPSRRGHATSRRLARRSRSCPNRSSPDDRRPERSDAERSADHAAIDRLSGELLPALIAKLGATGLGELEVREGGWRVRLRRPGDGQAGVRRDARRHARAAAGRARAVGTLRGRPGRRRICRPA